VSEMQDRLISEKKKILPIHGDAHPSAKPHLHHTLPPPAPDEAAGSERSRGAEAARPSLTPHHQLLFSGARSRAAAASPYPDFPPAPAHRAAAV
jgi:hypothetical protein